MHIINLNLLLIGASTFWLLCNDIHSNWTGSQGEFIFFIHAYTFNDCKMVALWHLKWENHLHIEHFYDNWYFVIILLGLILSITVKIKRQLGPYNLIWWEMFQVHTNLAQDMKNILKRFSAACTCVKTDLTCVLMLMFMKKTAAAATKQHILSNKKQSPYWCVSLGLCVQLKRNGKDISHIQSLSKRMLGFQTSATQDENRHHDDVTCSVIVYSNVFTDTSFASISTVQ